MSRIRRSASAPLGAIRVDGPPRLADALGHALEGTTAEPDTLTHGFHAWPARMHPMLAGALLDLGQGAENVLDPFAGGGTVLVEAMVRGISSVGVDLNPLAAIVARTRTEQRTRDERERFLDLATDVARRSEERVRERAPARAVLPPQLLSLHGVHVLKELAGLLEEIRAVEVRADREAMAAVFSSIVVKVSTKRGDTSDETAEKRIRKGLSTEIFLRKANELAERWAGLEAAVGAHHVPAPVMHTADVRDLVSTVGEGRFDLVVTSPPYGGTYDYHAHHALRLAWLRLDDSALAQAEIGSRRALTDSASWDRQVRGVLGQIAGVLRRGGRAALVLGDAEIAGKRLQALSQLRALGPRAGLEYVASASAERLDWQAGEPREEHVVLFRKES